MRIGVAPRELELMQVHLRVTYNEFDKLPKHEMHKRTIEKWVKGYGGERDPGDRTQILSETGVGLRGVLAFLTANNLEQLEGVEEAKWGPAEKGYALYVAAQAVISKYDGIRMYARLTGQTVPGDFREDELDVAMEVKDRLEAIYASEEAA
jgi:hypothetical protein